MGAQAVSLDSQTPDAGTFWAFIKSLLPVALLCFCLGVINHIGDACKERNWLQRLTVLIISGFVGMACGPMATVLAHELLPDHSDIFHMVIGCAVASMGPQATLMWLKKIRKLTTLNLGDPNDINDCRLTLSPEERARHADSCPFEPDRCGGACMSCPHRKEHHHA